MWIMYACLDGLGVSIMHCPDSWTFVRALVLTGECVEYNWRAGASLPSRPNGAIFLYIYLYISGVDVCRNVLRNSK